MDVDAHVAALEREGRRLLTAARHAGPGAPAPARRPRRGGHDVPPRLFEEAWGPHGVEWA